MSDIIELLETELEHAFEVKDKRALHRYVTILADRMVGRQEHESRSAKTGTQIGELRGEMQSEFAGVRSEIKLIAERMEQGFARMDERFAAVDKRFEQVDKRFEDMQAQMDKRFEQVDKRFEQVDKRFEQVDKRFNTVVVLSSTFFVVLATMMTVIRLFG